VATIIHVIDSLKVGGAQTHLVTMLREAVRSFDIQHRVLTLFDEGPIGDQIRQLGVPVDFANIGPALGNRRYLAAIRVLDDYFHKHQPDIVEAHLTFSRLVGLVAARKAGVPTRIGFEHGDIYLNSRKFRIANFLGQVFAHKIIVCSNALKEWCRQTHRITPNRLVVMHNCVDPNHFSPAPGASWMQPPVDAPIGKTRFCAIGSLGSGVNKRFDICIRAIQIARLKGADLSLVIAGDGDQRATLETLAQDLEITDNVHFLGVRSDVASIMATCDGFCHSAPWEPFGIVALEAMASALPIIVPRAGGIQEIVEEGVNGITYPALDAEALASAMIRLHQDPQLRRLLGSAGRKTVCARYSVEKYVQRLYAIYGLHPAGSTTSEAA